MVEVQSVRKCPGNPVKNRPMPAMLKWHVVPCIHGAQDPLWQNLVTLTVSSCTTPEARTHSHGGQESASIQERTLIPNLPVSAKDSILNPEFRTLKMMETEMTHMDQRVSTTQIMTLLMGQRLLSSQSLTISAPFFSMLRSLLSSWRKRKRSQGSTRLQGITQETH